VNRFDVAPWPVPNDLTAAIPSASTTAAWFDRDRHRLLLPDDDDEALATGEAV
jgi:hypothetical protein